jgi:hypothetical protein
MFLVSDSKAFEKLYEVDSRVNVYSQRCCKFEQDYLEKRDYLISSALMSDDTECGRTLNEVVVITCIRQQVSCSWRTRNDIFAFAFCRSMLVRE